MLAALLTLSAAPATAEDLTTPEFIELLEEAVEGESVTSDLTQVQTVDGIAVDIGPVASGDTAEVAARLRTLQSLATTAETPPESSDLREQASEITSNPPFTAEVAGGAGWFETAMNFIGRIFSGDLASGFALFVLIAITLLVAIPALTWLARRPTASDSREPAAATPEPVDYVAAAAEAENAGDYGRALRLLFRGGVLDLEAEGKLTNSAAATTNSVRRLAPTTEFLDRFDEVAYGGSEARNEDVGASRRSWADLLRRTP